MRGKKAQFFIEIVIHALFWLGVYYALRALTVSSVQVVARYNDRPTMNMNAQRLFTYLPVVLGALLLLFYGSVFGLFPRAIRMKSKGMGIAIVTGWALLLFGINYEVIRLLTGPARSMPGRHNTILGGPAGLQIQPLPPFLADDWMHMQGSMVAIFLSMLGIAVAYFFIKEWIRNDLRRSQAETQQLHAEIRFLRSQVNPHFLFNTLNNLFSMAQKRGHEELADSISKLSDMMRYMIYESNTDTVSLQREIAYLRDCIALNKLRYADSEVAICFHHPAPAVAAGAAVAPMLFVPFLENAFKHGVSIGRHSRIDLGISVEQKKLIFTCENTDHSAVKRLEEEKGGIGLENVRRRLELVYPGRHELRAGPEPGKYIVKLQIELA
jgi:two-component system LytT family sensor kinase